MEIVAHCKKAVVSFFNCETTEDIDAFPKVRISAEVTLCERGTFHHFNIDEVRNALEKAVGDASWFWKNFKPEARQDGDTADK